MKATLTKATGSRSLQRRWVLAEAAPVRSFLPPYTEFVPSDLRIWWSAETGQPAEGHSLHIYAWPQDRRSHTSAHWTGAHNHHPIPAWIRELSDTVHEDLIANATGTNTGAGDDWGYALSHDWTLEEAPRVPAIRTRGESFTPAELSIWFSHHSTGFNGNRHRITAYPADRKHSRLYADWGGGIDFDGSPSYAGDLPGWLRDMAEEQHRQLTAFAAEFESARGTRQP